MLKVARHAVWLAVVVVSGPVLAQTSPPTSEALRPITFKIQSTMNVSLVGQNLQNIEEQKTLLETARRATYDMANRECRTIRDVFGGDCRLVALNTNSSVQNRHGGTGGVETVQAGSTATYDVTIPASSRP